MTEQQLNKMLVAKLQQAERQIKTLKSQNEDLVRTHRTLHQTAENAKGGLQVRRESMAMVEQLRDAVTALLSVAEAWDCTTVDGRAEAVLFAKKIMFLTEGGSF
jgi:small-conductance mechanosensitive channel